MFDDLLSALAEDRRKHSVEVGQKVATEAHRVRASLRADLVVAATLHDIGYAHRRSGFHALDGAAFLAGEGFSRRVCHLAAHHSASTYEAEERGIDLAAYSAFDVDEDLSALDSLLAWAERTTLSSARRGGSGSWSQCQGC